MAYSLAELQSLFVGVAGKDDVGEFLFYLIAEFPERIHLALGSVGHADDVAAAAFHEGEGVHHSFGDVEGFPAQVFVDAADVPGDEGAARFHEESFLLQVGGLVLYVDDAVFYEVGEGDVGEP